MDKARFKWNYPCQICITLLPKMWDIRHQMAHKMRYKWDPEPLVEKWEHVGEVVANSLYSWKYFREGSVGILFLLYFLRII